jgi:cyclase
MNYEKVTDNIIFTKEGHGNSIAINLGSKIFVIDSTIGPKIAEMWKKEIKSFFPQQITTLLLTHYHADHTFGNQVFSDCSIVASEKTAKRMKNALKTNWTEANLKEWKESPDGKEYGLEELSIILPSITFTKKMTFLGEDGELSFFHSGGHTNGSSYLWEEHSKVIITGDLFFNKKYPYAADETVDPFLWQKALNDMISLQPDIIIPGHGPVATVEELKEFLQFIDNAIDFIDQQLNAGKTEKEIIDSPSAPTYYLGERIEWKNTMYKKWTSLIEEKRKDTEE